jgi:hypothetical protein
MSFVQRAKLWWIPLLNAPSVPISIEHCIVVLGFAMCSADDQELRPKQHNVNLELTAEEQK